MGKAPEIRVLAVFANPMGTAQLRLDREERVIREAIELSNLRDNIVLRTCPAATTRDVSRAFLKETYHIVHIAGHGSGQGLILSNEVGGHFLVNQSVLAELFEEYHESIRCVILNACYSFTQGSLLSQTIPFTIAMEYALDDRAAIKFSEGFYDTIAAGKSVEHAYREGKRRIKFEIPGATLLPQLIRQGEILPVQPEIKTTERPVESIHLTSTKALIGVALDLSTSMKRSFQNQEGENIYRLESIRNAFKEFTQVARRGVQENQTEDMPASIDMFIYGFGLRSIEVCDLLALWKASTQIITKDRIERITEQYKQEQHNTYGGYKGLGNVMREIGLGMAVNRFSDIAKQRAYTAIRKRIWHEAKDEVEREVRNIGSITLSIDEMIAWWEQSGDLLGNAEDLLFGTTTPIAETLTQIIARFEKELSVRDNDTMPILFLISDGKYATADPIPLAEKLRTMGITVFSCLVTDKDVVNPRQLLNRPLEAWDREAQLMFEMASPLNEGTNVENFLLQKGWTIYHPQPKLFVQLNHSDVLKEFIRVTLSHLETNSPYMLPQG